MMKEGRYGKERKKVERNGNRKESLEGHLINNDLHQKNTLVIVSTRARSFSFSILPFILKENRNRYFSHRSLLHFI